MKTFRDRRHITLDVEHMKRLHQEAIEQLDLMRTAVETTGQTIGTMRDKLETMSLNHWNRYLDVLHMITMHDENMSSIITTLDLKIRNNIPAEEIETPLVGHYALLLLLVHALIRRHRRFVDIYGWRGNPMSDYLKESMTMEREHMVELISMIQQIL